MSFYEHNQLLDQYKRKILLPWYLFLKYMTTVFKYIYLCRQEDALQYLDCITNILFCRHSLVQYMYEACTL